MKIDPILYKGRPADTRIPKEERCYELLDRLGVEYCRADHEHADTIEQCHEIEKLLGAEICKNLLLTNRQMTDVYLLLMPTACLLLRGLDVNAALRWRSAFTWGFVIFAWIGGAAAWLCRKIRRCS